MKTPMTQTMRSDKDGDWRRLTIPEEDRAKYTSVKWSGEFRWFRSPNVVPIEQWRGRARPSNKVTGCRNEKSW
jgi:hypothetical protein